MTCMAEREEGGGTSSRVSRRFTSCLDARTLNRLLSSSLATVQENNPQGGYTVRHLSLKRLSRINMSKCERENTNTLPTSMPFFFAKSRPSFPRVVPESPPTTSFPFRLILKLLFTPAPPPRLRSSRSRSPRPWSWPRPEVKGRLPETKKKNS